jgi:hypothetical protein
MNVHKNARLTPRGRGLMIDRIEVACRYGKQLRRAECRSERPIAGMADIAGVTASYRTAVRHLDAAHPGWLPEQIASIEGLRRQRLTSPVIARQLSMALSTVGLILRRIGLNRLPCSSAGRR